MTNADRSKLKQTLTYQRKSFDIWFIFIKDGKCWVFFLCYILHISILTKVIPSDSDHNFLPPSLINVYIKQYQINNLTCLIYYLYMCAKDIDFVSFYDFLIWFWTWSDRVIYFVFPFWLHILCRIFYTDLVHNIYRNSKFHWLLARYYISTV